MGRVFLSSKAIDLLICLEVEKVVENEGFDSFVCPSGHHIGLREVRYERIRKQNRQRTSSCPRRIPLANFPQIRPILLLPETTHLRRYFNRPWLGPLRRPLLRLLQEPLQIPRPCWRMAPEGQRRNRKRHGGRKDHRALAVRQAPRR